MAEQNPPTLVPVEGDPFAEQAHKLVPVDGDPFAETSQRPAEFPLVPGKPPAPSAQDIPSPSPSGGGGLESPAGAGPSPTEQFMPAAMNTDPIIREMVKAQTPVTTPSGTVFRRVKPEAATPEQVEQMGETLTPQGRSDRARYLEVFGDMQLPELKEYREKVIPDRIAKLKGMQAGFTEDQKNLEFSGTELDGMRYQIEQLRQTDPAAAQQMEAQYNVDVTAHNQAVGNLKKQGESIAGMMGAVERDERNTIAREYEVKSKMGTTGGATWNALMEGVGSTIAGLNTYLAALMPVESLGYPEGTTKDEIWKDTRKLLDQIREAPTEMVGDEGTTKEFSKEMQEGFLGGSWLGLVRSVPAMATPAMVGIGLQVFDDVQVEMQGPEFAGIPEDERLMTGVPIAGISMVLERLGFRNLIANKSLTRSILADVLTDLPAGATAEQIKTVLDAKTTSAVKNYMIRIGGAGAAEFETGLAQDVSTNILKDAYNLMRDKEMFSTPDGWKEYTKSALTAGAQEMMGAFILGQGQALSAARRTKQNVGDMTTPQQFEMIEELARDPNYEEALKQDLKMQVDRSKISEGQAKQVIADWNEAGKIVEKIPTALPVETRQRAFDLLSEKSRLSALDKNLVGDQLAAVNEKIGMLVGVMPEAKEGGEQKKAPVKKDTDPDPDLDIELGIERDAPATSENLATVDRQVQNLGRSLASIGTEIVVHETPEEFAKAAQEKRGLVGVDSYGGVFYGADNSIHINREQAAQSLSAQGSVPYHEGFHAVVLKALGSSPKADQVIGRAAQQIVREMPEMAAQLADFLGSYDGAVRNEDGTVDVEASIANPEVAHELFSEFGARLADGKIPMTDKVRQFIADMYNRVMAALGIGTTVQFTGDQDYVQAAKDIANAMRAGRKLNVKPATQNNQATDRASINAVSAKLAASKAAGDLAEEDFFGKLWPKALRDIGNTFRVTKPGIELAAGSLLSEIEGFMRDNPKFQDYYHKDWDATRAMLEDAFPQVKADPQLFTLFRAVTGLTSPNTYLELNMRDAVRAIDHWIKKGDFNAWKMGVSEKDGTARTVIKAPFGVSGNTGATKVMSMKVLEKLIKQQGGIDKAVEFLQQPVSMKELHAFNQKMGYAGNIRQPGPTKQIVQAATGQSELIPRMFVFGPKVGAYTMNAVGDGRYTTTDIWEARLIRSHFPGLFLNLNDAGPSTQEWGIFQAFAQSFADQFKKKFGYELDKSAYQALRWFYIINAVAKSGYRYAFTNGTISDYTAAALAKFTDHVVPGHTGTTGFASSTASGADPWLAEGSSPADVRFSKGRQSDGSLNGLPRKFKIGDTEHTASHLKSAEDVARKYMQSVGLPYSPPNDFAKVDRERAKRIADEYEKMSHAPDDPEVAASYKAMADETMAQWQAIKQSGLKVEFMKPGPDGVFVDPYAASPRMATEDVRNNNHLWVFPTEAGYGHEGSGSMGSLGVSTKPGQPDHVVETNDMAAFIRAAMHVRNTKRQGPVMGEVSEAKLSGARMFVSEDGQSGFAISPDGDLLNTFSAVTNRFPVLMEAAKANGVKKVDTLDTGIVQMYKKQGFEEVSREPWNDAYAPEGWDPSMGAPDHVYLEYNKPHGMRDYSHPLLADSGELIDGRKTVVNDVFRIVHDYFGHIKEGNGFRADGEENAWRAHSAMYSPLARKAMTSETRGQNSWVNFGPHAEKNRTASGADTIYADQKAALLPEWAVEDGRYDQEPIGDDTMAGASDVRASKKAAPSGSLVPKNLEKFLTKDDNGNYLFFHYGRDLQGGKVDPKYFGSNAGMLDQRSTPISMYYTKDGQRESMVHGDVYVVKIPEEKVYPFNTDPLGFYDQAEANFRKDFGNAIEFSPHRQADYMGPLAAKAGFDMMVTKWSAFPLRAESTKALPWDKALTNKARAGDLRFAAKLSKPPAGMAKTFNDRGFSPAKAAAYMAAAGISDAQQREVLKQMQKPIEEVAKSAAKSEKEPKTKAPEQKAAERMAEQGPLTKTNTPLPVKEQVEVEARGRKPVNDGKILVNEVAALKDQIRLEARAAKDSRSFERSRQQAFSARIKEMVDDLAGTLSPSQAKAIINRARAVTTPGRMAKFEVFATRVIDNANYAEQLAEANKLASGLRKSSGGETAQKKRSVDTSLALRRLGSIPSEEVEDLDMHLAVLYAAARVSEGPRVVGNDPLSVRIKNAVPVITVHDINAYAKQQEDAIERARIDELIKEFAALLEGIDTYGLTSDDIRAIVEAASNSDAEREALAKADLKNEKLKIAQLFAEEQKRALNFVDGAQLTSREQQVVNDAKAIDTSRLSAEQSIRLAQAIHDIVINETFGGAGYIQRVHNAQVRLTDLKAITNKYGLSWSRSLQPVRDAIRSFEHIIQAIARNRRASPDIQRALGTYQVRRDITSAAGSGNAIKNTFDVKKRNLGGAINKDTMIARAKRAMYALAIQERDDVPGENETFLMHKKMIEHSLDQYEMNRTWVMERFGEDITDDLRQAFNEVIGDSNSAWEVIQRNKSDELTTDLVHEAHNLAQAFQEELSEGALIDFNRRPPQIQGYTPIRWKVVSPRGLVGQQEGMFESSTNFGARIGNDPGANTYERVRGTQEGLALDFDFDTVFLESMADNIEDARTAKERAIMREMFSSPEMEAIVGPVALSRMKTGIQNMLGAQSWASGQESLRLGKIFNQALRNASGLALKSITAIPKQSAVLLSAQVALGRDQDLLAKNIFGPTVKSFTDPSHWAYRAMQDEPISHRGQSVMGGLEKISNRITADRPWKSSQPVREWGAWAVKGWLNIADKLLLPLVGTDAVAARASWLAFYEKSMREQGLPVDGPKNETAASYANSTTEGMQGASSNEAQAGVYRTDTTGKLFLSMVLPFSTFAMNQWARQNNNVRALAHGNSKAKAKAAVDLMALVAEVALFRLIGLHVVAPLASSAFGMLLQLAGGEEPEEETEEQKRERMLQQHQNLMSRIAGDIMFPALPTPARKGAETAVNQVVKRVSGDDQDFFYHYPEGPLDDMGMLSIPLKNLVDTYNVGEALATEELTDTQRSALKYSLTIHMLAAIGVSDQVMSSANRKLEKEVGLPKMISGKKTKEGPGSGPPGGPGEGPGAFPK